MKSSFQTILIVVFVIGFILAIAVFSGLFSSSSSTSTNSSKPSGQVMVWGILSPDIMSNYIDTFNTQNYGYTLNYSYHSPTNFYQDLIEALANGNSPDLVITSSEDISQIKSKLYTIPFSAYTERQFRDTNIDGAQLFLNSQGIVALPLLVDPLVVYYNKDMLAAKNFVTPPASWNDLQASIPLFTKHNAKGAITQSTIALGEADNVKHYRDILSALFLQTGNSIVGYSSATHSNQVMLNSTSATNTDPTAPLPAVQALTFYTSFADPTSSNYSWNNAQPDSLQAFLAGKSAFYIGRASELFTIQQQNPNLNFDVIQLFQSQNATRPITFGSFTAVAVMQKAPNMVAAYAAATQIASATDIDNLSKRFSLPPVRRDLLQAAQSNPYVSVFFQAALSAFSWPDPNPVSTNKVFRDMITNVNSNTTDVQTAILNASQSL